MCAIMLSALMILAGIWAIIAPPIASIAAIILVGWRIVFNGSSHLILSWLGERNEVLLPETVLGVLFLVGGCYVGLHLAGLITWLTVLLVAYLFLESILEFFLSFLLGSGWLLVDAILLFVLAAMIGRTWPVNTMRALGTLAAISFLVDGTGKLRISLATGQRIRAWTKQPAVSDQMNPPAR